MSQKLVFRRGNLVGNDHPVPAIEETLLSLACSYPSAVVLIVDEPGTFDFPSKKLIFVFSNLSLRFFELCLYS